MLTEARGWVKPPLLSAILQSGPSAALAGVPGEIAGPEAAAAREAEAHMLQWGGMPELLRLSNAGLLRQTGGLGDAVTGEFFENHVVSEIWKWCATAAEQVTLYFYRTRSGMEVDLLIETPRGLLGVEIKRRAEVARSDATGLRRLAAACAGRWAGGLVVHAGQRIERMENDLWAVPSWRLLSGVALGEFAFAFLFRTDTPCPCEGHKVVRVGDPGRGRSLFRERRMTQARPESTRTFQGGMRTPRGRQGAV